MSLAGAPQAAPCTGQAQLVHEDGEGARCGVGTETLPGRDDALSLFSLAALAVLPVYPCLAMHLAGLHLLASWADLGWAGGPWAAVTLETFSRSALICNPHP